MNKFQKKITINFKTSENVDIKAGSFDIEGVECALKEINKDANSKSTEL